MNKFDSGPSIKSYNKLQDWFDFKIPRTKIEPDFIQNALQKETVFSTKPNAKIVWTGGIPLVETFTKSKKGNSWEMMQLTFHQKTHSFEISIEEEIQISKLLTLFVKSQYSRSINELNRGSFSVKGDVVDIFPSYSDIYYRINFNFIQNCFVISFID